MQDIKLAIPDPSAMYTDASVVEAKPVTSAPPSQKQESHEGLYVDRGVGSPRQVKSANADTIAADLQVGSENKVITTFI